MVPALRQYDVKQHRHANLPCYLIFDQQYIDGFSFIDAPRGSEVPAWVSRANTIEELAGKLKIDAAGLAATVAALQRLCAQGRRTRISGAAKRPGASPRRMSGSRRAPTRPMSARRSARLRIPPFYGVELHPSVFASAGLVANASAQVIDQRARLIPGLYAAGNNAVHTEYGVGYQAGFSLGSGMTFGYLAARHMAGLN